MDAEPPQLNEWQARVVESRARHLIVRAGPGSGKTATIAHLVARAVAEGTRPRRIAVFTFGRRAAGEVQARLRTLGVRGVTAGTLHGMAYRLVTHHHHLLEYRCKPVLYSSADRDELMQRCLAGTKRRSAAGLRRRLDQMAAGTGPIADDYSEAAARYWAQLRADGAADYGLLILDAIRILSGGDFVAPFDLVIIDEGQDLDQMQARLAMELTGGRLVAVSDPDQAIFSWRGASPEWVGALALPEVITLPKSYRCAKAILDEACWMLGEERDLIPAEHEGEVAECGPDDLCGAVVDALGRSRSFAVLCRTNHDADRASHELLVKGITHRRHVAGEQILEREAIRDALALLAFPELRRSRWVLLRVGKMFGIGAVTVSQIIAAAVAAEVDYFDVALAEVPALRDYYESAADEATWPSMLDRLSIAIRRAGLDQRSGDWMLQHAASFAMETPIAEQFPSAYMAHLGGCDDLLPGERESGACVMTMHAAKGLEFDEVAIFADRRPASWKEEPTPDERRLLYVSATRARHKLIVMSPSFARPWWARRR